MANFGLVLPIVRIYSLGKVTKIGEGGGLPDVRNLIFDVVGKAIIKVVPEGTFSVTLDLQSNPIELHDVLYSGSNNCPNVCMFVTKVNTP